MKLSYQTKEFLRQASRHFDEDTAYPTVTLRQAVKAMREGHLRANDDVVEELLLLAEEEGMDTLIQASVQTYSPEPGYDHYRKPPDKKGDPYKPFLYFRKVEEPGLWLIGVVKDELKRVITRDDYKRFDQVWVSVGPPGHTNDLEVTFHGNGKLIYDRHTLACLRTFMRELEKHVKSDTLQKDGVNTLYSYTNDGDGFVTMTREAGY